MQEVLNSKVHSRKKERNDLLNEIMEGKLLNQTEREEESKGEQKMENKLKRKREKEKNIKIVTK